MFIAMLFKTFEVRLCHHIIFEEECVYVTVGFCVIRTERSVEVLRVKFWAHVLSSDVTDAIR